MLHDRVDQALVGKNNHVESRTEQKNPVLEGPNNEADSAMEEQMEPDV